MKNCKTVVNYVSIFIWYVQTTRVEFISGCNLFNLPKLQ